MIIWVTKGTKMVKSKTMNKYKKKHKLFTIILFNHVEAPRALAWW